MVTYLKLSVRKEGRKEGREEGFDVIDSCFSPPQPLLISSIMRCTHKAILSKSEYHAILQ